MPARPRRRSRQRRRLAASCDRNAGRLRSLLRGIFASPGSPSAITIPYVDVARPARRAGIVAATPTATGARTGIDGRLVGFDLAGERARVAVTGLHLDRERAARLLQARHLFRRDLR